MSLCHYLVHPSPAHNTTLSLNYLHLQSQFNTDMAQKMPCHVTYCIALNTTCYNCTRLWFFGLGSTMVFSFAKYRNNNHMTSEIIRMIGNLII